MPNYYALLPAFVRYDKNLTHLEKLMYAEISALTNKNGYCHASNAYFSNLYGNSERTISRSIANLQDKGYVSCMIETVGNTSNRKIFLVPPEFRGVDKNGEGRQKCLGGVDKNVQLNNTSNNNTSIINSSIPESPKLFAWLGKRPVERLAKFYDLLWEAKFKQKRVTVITGADGGHLKRLIETYGEVIAGVLVVIHFQWYGASGNSDITYQRLYDNGFPIGWMSGNAPVYSAYMKSQLSINTEEEALEKIDKMLKELGMWPEDQVIQ